jgi:hypothetical protein
MSTRISIKFLQAQVDRLNRMTNSPVESWTRGTDGKLRANIGNYHLDGAYGGYALERMVSEGGGVSNVLRVGHLPKAELSDRIDAFMTGIEAGKGKA